MFVFDEMMYDGNHICMEHEDLRSEVLRCYTTKVNTN